jgi:hypothetical protein
LEFYEEKKDCELKECQEFLEILLDCTNVWHPSPDAKTDSKSYTTNHSSNPISYNRANSFCNSASDTGTNARSDSANKFSITSTCFVSICVSHLLTIPRDLL